jgi:hypothetical protein
MPHAVEKPGGAAEGEVHNCVSNLIRAFVDGLDVFKRLRERRRRKKKSRGDADRCVAKEVSGQELQLSNSLREAPQDIENCYRSYHSKAGERFAKGDGEYSRVGLWELS